jgi:hypothetical protein
MRRKAGEPSELVSIPMLGGKSTGAFVLVGNRVATSLAGNATCLEIFGRGRDAIIWAIGLF